MCTSYNYVQGLFRSINFMKIFRMENIPELPIEDQKQKKANTELQNSIPRSMSVNRKR